MWKTRRRVKNRKASTSGAITSHVHLATERYIHANRKSEGYAEATRVYRTLAGALNHLVQRANVQGLKTEPDGAQQAGLFGDKS